MSDVHVTVWRHLYGSTSSSAPSHCSHASASALYLSTATPQWRPSASHPCCSARTEGLRRGALVIGRAALRPCSAAFAGRTGGTGMRPC
eukprot:6550200-Prymnesium_polylepis.2